MHLKGTILRVRLTPVRITASVGRGAVGLIMTPKKQLPPHLIEIGGMSVRQQSAGDQSPLLSLNGDR